MIAARLSKALSTWAITVAQAAPATPIPNPATNTRSRTALSMVVAITIRIGVLLSPTARSMDENALYM